MGGLELAALLHGEGVLHLEAEDRRGTLGDGAAEPHERLALPLLPFPSFLFPPLFLFARRA